MINETMKIRYVFLSSLIWLVLFLVILALFPSNASYLLLQNNFYIPKESGLFSFRATVWATGSGEGWIYGEDNKNYYMDHYDPDSGTEYYILRKGRESKDLEKFNYIETVKKELYKLSAVNNSQEEYDRNIEHIREEFKKRGVGSKCRPRKSRWLGGC